MDGQIDISGRRRGLRREDATEPSARAQLARCCPSPNLEEKIQPRHGARTRSPRLPPRWPLSISDLVSVIGLQL